jgi:hypothetical protein
MFCLCVSYQKKRDTWIIRRTNLEHNHAPNPDPFQYLQHRDKKPGYTKAISAAATHRGIISYRQSAEILAKDGLEIDRKQFYNLHRKEEKGTLTRQEELELTACLGTVSFAVAN